MYLAGKKDLLRFTLKHAELQELAAGRQQESSDDSNSNSDSREMSRGGVQFEYKTLAAVADLAWAAFVIMSQVVTQC